MGIDVSPAFAPVLGDVLISIVDTANLGSLFGSMICSDLFRGEPMVGLLFAWFVGKGKSTGRLSSSASPPPPAHEANMALSLTTRWWPYWSRPVVPARTWRSGRLPQFGPSSFCFSLSTFPPLSPPSSPSPHFPTPILLAGIFRGKGLRSSLLFSSLSFLVYLLFEVLVFHKFFWILSASFL